MGKLSIANLHMFDRAAITVSYIWAKVRKVKREYGEKKRILIVLDYLQLITGEGKQYTNRYAEISEISRSPKTNGKRTGRGRAGTLSAQQGSGRPAGKTPDAL
ncbi:DnaB helicase C-terminal domain-containing protein [Peribacillus glennii]|uniref:DnaB helicase C-terminal domain-containing protein n=1 Tax=Peribacillus glennii TaxID=2303991 RepID=UPI001F1F9575|nr:DnaB helicase C-terminal domain-containing protein [Peribacillus glennii]